MADAAAPPAPVIRFRNYQPRDGGLVGAPPPARVGGAAAPAPGPPRVAVGTIVAPLPAPSVLLAERESAEKAELMAKAKDPGAITLAPRKPHWDLARDVSGKLATLDRRTSRAIADILRERVAAAAAAKAGGGGATAAGSAEGDADARRARSAAGVASGGGGGAGGGGSGAGIEPLDERVEGLDGAALAREVLRRGEGGGDDDDEVEEGEGQEGGSGDEEGQGKGGKEGWAGGGGGGLGAPAGFGAGGGIRGAGGLAGTQTGQQAQKRRRYEQDD